VKVSVEINGIAGSLSKSVTTTESRNWQEDGIQIKKSKGKNQAELQPLSVNTLVF
jgi:hypothetical protein